MRTDTMLQDRQVGVVDARGNAASFTGKTTFDWAGGRVGMAGRPASSGSGSGASAGKGSRNAGASAETKELPQVSRSGGQPPSSDVEETK